MKFVLMSALLLTTTLTGCSLIFTGDSQVVRMTSSPNGASVMIDGHPKGTTPLEIDLKTTQGYNVKIEHEGHYADFFHVNRGSRFNFWIVLDYIFAVPYLVDQLTGASSEFDHDSYHVTLTPIDEQTGH